jgi:DNA-binding phage protein
LERIQRTKSQAVEKEIILREKQEAQMALTRDFKETIKKRVECDPDFAKSLLHEAIDLLLDGDSATAKLILRDLVNATVGFERLAEEVQKPSKSLHRMLSTSGNPTMENLSVIFATIKKALHVRIDTTVTAV